MVIGAVVFFIASIIGTVLVTRSVIKNTQAIKEANDAISIAERTNEIIIERIKWMDRSNVVLVRSNESLAKDIKAADAILRSDSIADAIRAYSKI
jgi:hypothetical protein